ncbi:peroxiredoxin [Gluconacetobacter azotocaptans]|uniref:Thioredoxin peroxidase n=1 Tax=Gluconacetobacter azotocaptans TaxID=142834 RepID=A0A7W4JUE2_9PROT|nr:peroxiredoxin [Gluconacetobacter azotocaptans]MBB2191048.1 peroxiredoxin [Gluconacetobacter azotocaptans]GBQ31321.1 peroxiredoxin [Gluconacetobacter azotocaptans DSM 13594]
MTDRTIFDADAAADIPSARAGRPLRIGDAAPDFCARTTQGEVRLSDYRGRWLVFFSHPADFTPVCTSEFVALAGAADRFAALDCALLGLSVDSLHAHLAWMEAIRARFGTAVPFPVVEDPTMAVGRAYGMLDATAQDSATVRATYFIDPEGIVRAITCYPMSVGRSVAEMLRLVAALQRAARGDALTPEGWTPGADIVLPAARTEDEVTATGPSWFCRLAPDPLA